VRQIEIHPEVYDELEQARSWYETQTAGLGNDFLDEVERAINAVQRAPDAWPIYMNVHRYLVHRFPFAILYRYDDFKIRIYAVMHLRRKPGYWKSRKF
jgi:hypothetical protein